MPSLTDPARALLTDDLLRSVGVTLNDTAGVVPAGRAGLVALLAADPSVIFDAAQWGAGDTDVRGRLCDLVVRQLKIADRWPEGRDRHIDIDDFCARVEAAARHAGWHVAADTGRWPGLPA